MQDIQKELSRAKILMMEKKGSIFFSTVCLSLKTIITDKVPTAATNGIYIKYNPTFFLGLTDEERVFTIAHETLHVAYMHNFRRDGRNPRRWNVAADYVINLQLKKQGYTLIKGVLYDPRFEGMSTEQVYKILEDEDNNESPDHEDVEDPGQALPGESDAVSDLTQAEFEELKDQVASVLVRAKTLAAMQGEFVLPEGIERILSDILSPKLPWAQITKRFVQSAVNTQDYSWKRPNTRYSVLLPTLRSNTLHRIDFAIDTSGSIKDKEFNQSMAELFGALKSLRPKEIGVIQFDHEIRGNDVIKNAKDIQRLPLRGGGGTLASRAFEAFALNKKSVALIILTDGFIHPRDVIPGTEKRPVVWCVYDNPKFLLANSRKQDKVIHFNLR